MISNVTDMQVWSLKPGGATRITWVNPTDAAFDHVVILRKSSSTFSGISDPQATRVYSGPGFQFPDTRAVYRESPAVEPERQRMFIDHDGVGWNTTWYYAIYATDALESDVSQAVVVGVTQPPISDLIELDTLSVLVAFLESALQTMIDTGTLTIRPNSTSIPVRNAPPRLDDVTFPVVSVHLDRDAPEAFALGDLVYDVDQNNDAGVKREGYLARQTFSIIAWAGDNPEIRVALYRALKAVLMMSRHLLEELGMANVTIEGRYQEDFESYQMPMYMAWFTLSGVVESSILVPSGNVLATIDVNPPQASGVKLC